MTNTPHSRLRLRRRLLPVLVPALLPLAALVSSVPRAAAVTVTPQPVTDGFVDSVLAATGGIGVYADDSSVTNCMGPDGGRVVYSTDRIMARSALPDAQLVDGVQSALADIGVVGGGAAVHERVPIPGIVQAPLVEIGLTGVPGDKIVPLTRRLTALGHRVAPNYYFQPAGGPTYMWPNGRPDPIASLPPARPTGIGSAASIVLYDTGVPSTTEANVPSNMTKLGAYDVEIIDADKNGQVDRHDSGHSTAIVGLLRQLAPGARVQVARVAEAQGVTTDLSAARRMAQSLMAADAAGKWPSIVIAAFAAPACDVDPTRPGVQLQSMGLQAVAEAIAIKGKTVFIASAGNVGSSHPFYPAAFPGVTAVGAMDTSIDGDGSAYTSRTRTGPRASFSNFGPWVSLWASGVALPTYHVKNVRFGPDGPLLRGLGAVQGTSYAAPMAAAAVADTMTRLGLGPVDALAALVASGVRCSSAIGGGTAVALTSMTASPVTPAPAGAPVNC